MTCSLNSNWTNLSKYDFNNDGKVDLNDYSTATNWFFSGNQTIGEKNEKEVQTFFSRVLLLNKSESTGDSFESNSSIITSIENAEDTVSQLGVSISNVTTQNLSSKTEEELQAMLATLKEQIQELEKQESECRQKRDKMKSLQEVAENKKTEAEADYYQKLKKLNDEQATLDHLVENYAELTENLEELNSDIETKQKDEEDKAKNNVQTIVHNAIQNYDKEKDGDFAAYLSSILNGANIGNNSALESMNSQAVSTANQANTILATITVQAQTVAELTNTVNIAQTVYKEASVALKVANENLNAAETELTNVQTQLTNARVMQLCTMDEIAKRVDEENEDTTESQISDTTTSESQPNTTKMTDSPIVFISTLNTTNTLATDLTQKTIGNAEKETTKNNTEQSGTETLNPFKFVALTLNSVSAETKMVDFDSILSSAKATPEPEDKKVNKEDKEEKSKNKK